MKPCRNCEKSLSEGDKFCPHCGQRDFGGRLRMRDILGKMFSSFTHLDNKFFTMTWHLLIPARVTINYFKGQISRYPHPFQFFFIVMFFFLMMFGKHFGAQSFDILGGNLLFGKEEETAKVGAVHVSASKLYEALHRCMVAREYRIAGESLPASWLTDTTLLALDSIHNKASKPWEEATQMLLQELEDTPDSSINFLDTLYILNHFNSIKIATIDVVTLDPDTIIQRYGYHDFLDKLIIRQGVKSIRDQHSFITKYLGSFAWAVLLQIACMALLLRLLFRRKGRYYAEHFVFLVHQQSGAFLLLTLALAIHDFIFPLRFVLLLIFAWIGVFRMIGLQRYFGGTWWKNILKWIVFMAFNYVFLMLFFVLTLMAVFVIF